MQSDEKFCQIQGHEEQKLSYVCIFLECLCTSRWICSECVKKKIHNHYDGIHGFSHFRTEDQFMTYFKMKIQPLIELKLNSSEGNLIKESYLKKIFLDLQNLKTQQKLLKFINDQLYNDLVMLIELSSNLIKNYEDERIKVQDLNKIYLKLQNGLRFLKTNEISVLLNIDSNSQTIEMQIYKEILYRAKKYESYQNANNNEVKLETFIKTLLEASKRLLKLKDYINYQVYHQIFSDRQSVDYMQLSQNEKFLAILDSKNNQIKISQLQTKMLTKQYQFRFEIQYRAFDQSLKYMIIQSRTNLYYCLLSNNKKSIKLIKQKTIRNPFKGLIFINFDKIMIILEKCIQIKDFRDRCVNEINFQQDSDLRLKMLLYGMIKKIIVLILGDESDSIYIYRHNQRQPFIKKNIEELGIQFKLISLTNDDQHLLTQDTYELRLWQIDYIRQQLILINRVQINKSEQYRFSHHASEYNIIRLLNGQMQILDKNFNIIFEIRQHSQYGPGIIMISQNFILTADQVSVLYSHKINIVKKALTQYDKLQY